MTTDDGLEDVLKLQWFLRSSHDFQGFDRFMVGPFHLCIMGTHLTVESDGAAESVELRTAATDVANRYLAALKTRIPWLVSLVTFEEYAAALPPFQQQIDSTGSIAAERKQIGEGLCFARGQMLASSDEPDKS